MTAPEPGEPADAPPAPSENPVLDWARAVLGGIRDTARDVLDEGRRGAREAYDEYWERFEAKTRHRRRKRDS